MPSYTGVPYQSHLGREGGVLKTVLVWGAFIIIISKAFQFCVEKA